MVISETILVGGAILTSVTTYMIEQALVIVQQTGNGSGNRALLGKKYIRFDLFDNNALRRQFTEICTLTGAQILTDMGIELLVITEWLTMSTGKQNITRMIVVLLVNIPQCYFQQTLQDKS